MKKVLVAVLVMGFLTISAPQAFAANVMVKSICSDNQARYAWTVSNDGQEDWPYKWKLVNGLNETIDEGSGLSRAFNVGTFTTPSTKGASLRFSYPTEQGGLEYINGGAAFPDNAFCEAAPVIETAPTPVPAPVPQPITKMIRVEINGRSVDVLEHPQTEKEVLAKIIWLLEQIFDQKN